MRPGSPDRIIFETPDVCVGEFRCPIGHPAFRDSGPSSHDCFAFARSAVIIRYGRERIVADPNVATMYNRGQEFNREPLSRRGDFCEWFGVSPRLLRQAVAAIDPRGSDALRPIRFTHAPVEASTYLLQRQVYRGAVSRRADSLWVEESVVELLDRVLSSAADADAIAANLGRRQRDLVDDTKCVLSHDLARPLGLAEIAEAVGTSMFHLCRCFRFLTGRSLHNYRTELRLRHGLEALEGGERDLTRVALDCGFSSHSHFTAAFRRAFGDPPSRVRAAISAGERHSK